MEADDRLQQYLRTWNLTIRESRIAGKGNKFEVIHQFPDSRHQRVMGEFLLGDEDMVKMDGYDVEKVTHFIFEHVRYIVSEVVDKSVVQAENWYLRPTGLI